MVRPISEAEYIKDPPGIRCPSPAFCRKEAGRLIRSEIDMQCRTNVGTVFVAAEDILGEGALGRLDAGSRATASTCA
jgi:hypothetical protein